MRGDRPGASRICRAAGPATPHARGSTRTLVKLVPVDDGYPACAGIDLPQRFRSRARSWLPRMRGDRPAWNRYGAAQALATPHARGSTRLESLWSSPSPGYPACAGIDPSLRTSCSRRRGLPRMRGDRPVHVAGYTHGSLATPHARGSTSEVRKLRAGYPACAGIDPPTYGGRQAGVRLPRMRGDRPIERHVPRRPRQATPHARGSTQLAHGLSASPRGYPACAGIDLACSEIEDLEMRLPRMRGDRPYIGIWLLRRHVATPHARGSTLMMLTFGDLRKGYPACAGIDPHPDAPQTWRGWLPRMRGDRPVCSDSSAALASATPHARGSTPRCSPRTARPQGYPACAGIDLSSSLPRR